MQYLWVYNHLFLITKTLIKQIKFFLIIPAIVAAIYFSMPNAFALGQPVFAFHIVGIKDENILNSLNNRLNAAIANQPHPLTPALILKCHADNANIILNTLHAYGYYRAQVHSSFFHIHDYWEATYMLYPGPAIPIRHLYLKIIGEGAYEPYFSDLAANLPLHEHTALTIENYNKTKQLLFTTAEQNGYLKAQFIQHTILIDLQQYHADVIISFDTGPRYYFGPVNFNQTPLSEKFLKRFSPFKQGEPYSSTKLLKFQESLATSNYFSDVNVQPNLKPNEYQVPINTHVAMRKKYQYTVGAGYGTDTGPRAILGWDWRYVTTTGQQLSTLLQVSQVQQLVNATYSIPGSNPLTDQYNLTLSAFDNSLPHARSETYQIGTNYIKTLEKWQQIAL